MNFIKPNSIKNIHKLRIAPMMDCTDKHFRMKMRKMAGKKKNMKDHHLKEEGKKDVRS